jgi:hypothetical protein
MTSPVNLFPTTIEGLLTRPSVWELARLYPEHTYVHPISDGIVTLEEQAIARAFSVGYRKADSIESFQVFDLAVKVLMRKLLEVADYNSIYDFIYEYTANLEGHVEVIFVFENIAHAVQFKFAASLMRSYESYE